MPVWTGGASTYRKQLRPRRSASPPDHRILFASAMRGVRRQRIMGPASRPGDVLVMAPASATPLKPCLEEQSAPIPGAAPTFPIRLTRGLQAEAELLAPLKWYFSPEHGRCQWGCGDARWSSNWVNAAGSLIPLAEFDLGDPHQNQSPSGITYFGLSLFFAKVFSIPLFCLIFGSHDLISTHQFDSPKRSHRAR